MDSSADTLNALQSILASLVEIFKPVLEISNSVATITVFLKYLLILLTVLVGIVVLYLVRRILLAVFEFAKKFLAKILYKIRGR